MRDRKRWARLPAERYNLATDFDGAYLDSGAYNATFARGFTICGWFNFDSGGSSWRTPFSCLEAAQTGAMLTTNGSGALAIYLGDYTAWSTSDIDITSDLWIFGALVINSVDLTYGYARHEYHDKLFEISRGSHTEGLEGVWVGANQSFGEPMNGPMVGVKAWDRRLTKKECYRESLQIHPVDHREIAFYLPLVESIGTAGRNYGRQDIAFTTVDGPFTMERADLPVPMFHRKPSRAPGFVGALDPGANEPRPVLMGAGY